MEIGLITIGSEPDCQDLPEAGTRARLILINFSDVKKMYSDDDGRIIEIVMKDGKFGYEFLGFRSDVKKEDEVVRRDKSKQRFKHFVSFVVYENSQIQKNNIRAIVQGRFIAIVENNGRDDNSIEVLGRECGLSIRDGQIRNAQQDGGLFIINLGTPDNGIEFERKLPQALGISYENGLQIIEDLLTPLSPVTWDSTEYTFDSTVMTFDTTFI